MKRKPNIECSVCKKLIYRRPSQIHKTKNVCCSRSCLTVLQRTREEVTCQCCGVKFFPKHSGKKAKTCSRSCANKNREGIKYDKKFSNNSKKRLHVLKNKFNFDSCMVEGCKYNKTYDIHRLVAGKDEGKYKIGNMFAICPNHHAESHRGLIEFEKVNNCTLRIKNKKYD
jgi:hypothetical protein